MSAGVARPRVVILGGGFAGVYTALALEKALGERDDFEIVLVNRENYFVFQPMLPEVISGSIGLTDVVVPLRRLLRRSAVHVRDVETVDLAARVVTTSPGFRPHPHRVGYDHLVLGLGNVTDFRGLPGLPEHALPFKNLGDALRLRNHVIRAFEEASIETEDEALRRQLLTFVVAGGGFSGVEVAAELNDFVREVASSYRGIDAAEVRVVLVHSQERILPEMAEPLALFAQRLLQKRGVELRLRHRLQSATGTEVILAGGDSIPTRTLVSTVPASPHPLLESLPLPKGRGGRLVTTPDLRVEGTTDVWAVGDCALATTPDGAVAPPTAQHATRQAEACAHNVVAAIRGGGRRVFDFKGLGKMGSLGRHSAVAEVLGLRFSGFLAWWLWRTVYLMKMPGWGRRLKVATSWTLDLVLPPDLVELRLGSSQGLTREHYEAGEEVFREGDLGDSLYIVLSGEAEVVKGSPPSEEVTLAHLGPGEVFGEMALIEHKTRNATVRCRAAMDVLRMPQQEFAALAAHLPDLRTSVEKVMAGRRPRP